MALAMALVEILWNMMDVYYVIYKLREEEMLINIKKGGGEEWRDGDEGWR